jgi:hypothetical protein
VRFRISTRLDRSPRTLAIYKIESGKREHRERDLQSLEPAIASATSKPLCDQEGDEEHVSGAVCTTAEIESSRSSLIFMLCYDWTTLVTHREHFDVSSQVPHILATVRTSESRYTGSKE